MSVTLASTHVDEYFSNTDRRLNQIPDEGHKAAFINDELSKWEKAEDRLARWAARDDGSPNPFSPPLDAFQIASIICGLNTRLCALQDRVRAAITAAEALLSSH